MKELIHNSSYKVVNNIQNKFKNIENWATNGSIYLFKKST